METKEQLRGLTDQQVEESRRKHGENILPPPARTPLWRQFLAKFADPMIRILLIAFVASLVISCVQYFRNADGMAEEFLEPLGILLAIVLSTGIGFWFEVRAGRAFDSLNRMSDDDPVQVVRGGRVAEVRKRDVVVGDVVVLGTGNEIPADGNLAEAVSLSVNESTLTGEPMVRKSVAEDEQDSQATYPTCRVLRGTTVTEGHGLMVVDAVGDATESGKVFTAAQIDNGETTPLDRQLEGLSRVITKVSYALAAILVVGRIALHLLSYGTADPFALLAMVLQTVMMAVTLIVVAVPEGLPMSVTLSLALSMRRMLKSNNLVRKLHACETMGETTVICTDKTGTLTQNQMRVGQAHFFGLPGQQELNGSEMAALVKEGIAANSTAFLDTTRADAPEVMGNPTEGALLLWLRGQGEDYEPLRQGAEVVEQLTFSTERKYMATLVRSSLLPGRLVLYVKGAPEIVHALCQSTVGNVPFEDISQQLAQHQNKAMRTLGFACQVMPEQHAPIFENGRLVTTKGAADALEFLGFVAISDPVRKEVPHAVAQCQRAGISIKIVTGDTPNTAREIGRQIGLWTEADDERNEITGPEFAALSDQELDQRVLDLKIISRARPLDKKRLVETLQKKGQVVAVTGDGTNDAPALKAAHVGLSMGDGTSVAKEASDITILDNSFFSIANAVMWGRSLYRNIQRFILFQMTINVVACLIVLLGAFVGTEAPLTVTQMLWVNLIMDTLAAMALASLPPSPEVMLERPRRQSAFIITRPMRLTIGLVGVVFTALLVVLLLFLERYDLTSLAGLANGLPAVSAASQLTTYEISVFFTVFVMMQFWNLFNARAFLTGHSAFRGLRHAPGFAFVAGCILLGQVVIVTFGGKMFSVCPLPPADWALIVGSTSLILWVGEGLRLLRPARQKAQ